MASNQVNARVPVTLLTGFLGSGKTTLLGKLIRSPGMHDAAVIVNEFGSVGLDHLLVEPGREDVVLLDSGCLCCVVSDGLAETLEDLHYRRLRGQIPAFSRVLIETSGLADPAPIMHLLLADPGVTKWYILDGVVATVDALLGTAQLEEHDVSRKQAAMADLLVITKVDAVDNDTADEVALRLRALNPRARQVRAAHGDLSAEALMSVAPLGPEALSAEVRGWLTPEPGARTPAHHHRHDVFSFTVTLDAPMQWFEYAEWLQRLRAFPAQNLLRVKGIVALGENAEPHVVQGVQHVFAHPTPLGAWPWHDRRSRLVFIVQDLAPARIAETLAAHRATVDAAAEPT